MLAALEAGGLFDIGLLLLAALAVKRLDSSML
jgi:hypothetical protein